MINVKLQMTNDKLQERKNGYVLLSVLVIMTVLIVMMFFFSDALFSEQAISSNQKSATACFNLAEAGIQEAVWRIQNDSTTRDTFLHTTNGLTTFSHNTNLMTNASYTVTIQNTAEGAATITGTGYYQAGIKQAKRVVTTNVTKATTPPPYTNNAAIFTGGNTGEEDMTFSNATVNITGDELQDTDNNPLTPMVLVPIASLISSRDIWYTDSTVNVAKDILAKRDIRKVNSTVTAGGIIQESTGGTYTMPAVDVTSSDPYSYKSLAKAENHYFTSSAFKTLLQNAGNLTYTGVVYVAGAGFTIDDNETLTINGILISEGNIDVGKNNNKGSLLINTNGTNPSGIISLAKLNINGPGVLDVKGIIYLGDRFQFDPYDHSVPAAQTINIEGGVLTRRIDGNGPRILNIKLNKDLIDRALSGGTSCGGTVNIAADPKILRPNSDIETFFQPMNCTNRYDCVSDQSDTTFVTAIRGTHVTATYGTPANGVPSNATNISVTDHIRVRTNDIASNAAVPVLRVNGADYIWSAPRFSSVFTNFSTTWTTNPNSPGGTAPWTVADLALTFPGVKVDAYGAVGEQVSEVWLVINYDTPVASGGGACGSTESPIIKMQHWEEEY